MLPFIRPQDVVDILIMSFLVYQLYSWFKDTRALQVVTGLGFLVLLYVVTKNLGLFMTSWILQELGTVLFVLVIVIFQTEIRQALYRFSLLRNLFGRRDIEQQIDLMELAQTIFSLADSRTGAIIVFQRAEVLEDHLLHGVKLDSLVNAQLLETIFRDGTPLHDGAVVIRGDRITQASCHLPLSSHGDLPRHYGTRHRAGVGLSERSDAAVVIVSEERGEVSLALGGELRLMADPRRLKDALNDLLAPPSPERVKLSVRKRLFSNLASKLTILALVSVSWLVVSARQGGIVTVLAPIKFRNLPDNLTLMKASPEEVEVQLKAFSPLLSSPKQLDVVADINLGRIREGSNQLTILNEDLRVPLGVVVSGINPSTVRVTAEKKVRKTLQVRVKTVGRLQGKGRLKRVRTDPASVIAEGPEHLLAQINSVDTEAVDLSAITQEIVVTRRLLQPAPQISFPAEGEVKIHVGGGD